MSSTNSNRCKLLVFNIDTNRLNFNDLRTFFTEHGPIEWIKIFPKFSSAIIQFRSYLSVDRLVSYRRCLIDKNDVRLRRFRLDKINCHIDCHILRVKSTNVNLTESLLLNCFEKYQCHIVKINLYSNNQASIFFSDYDYVDQILLLPLNSFQINNDESLGLERMIERKRLQVRKRDPIIQQLFDQIEHLSKQLREQPGNSRDEIERLEAELFILKNENAQLKSKQSNHNIDKRPTALADISNRILIEPCYHKRSRSNSNETPIKRRRENSKLND